MALRAVYKRAEPSTNLNTLVEEGYVAKGRIDDRTNSYELTAEAKQRLAERQQWQAERLPTQ